MCFVVNEKPTRDSISLYNNVGLISNGPEDIMTKELKIAVVDRPFVV